MFFYAKVQKHHATKKSVKALIKEEQFIAVSHYCLLLRNSQMGKIIASVNDPLHKRCTLSKQLGRKLGCEQVIRLFEPSAIGRFVRGTNSIRTTCRDLCLAPELG